LDSLFGVTRTSDFDHLGRKRLCTHPIILKSFKPYIYYSPTSLLLKLSEPIAQQAVRTGSIPPLEGLPMSAPHHDGQRPYDLVVLGATGYTGGLTAEFIATNLPTDLRWAIAGRSNKKLEALAAQCKALDPDRIQPGQLITRASSRRSCFVLSLHLNCFERGNCTDHFISH
jgi:hypothetical protein